MKLPSLNALAGAFVALISAVILTSCGGGGAAGNPSQPGSPIITVLPRETTVYAGLPATFTIIGGSAPYIVNASEPNVLPVPTRVNSQSFSVVPNNPGVIDPSLPAGSLPIRTVIVTVASGNGASATSTVHVGQNFLTGYGASFAPSACPTGAQIPTTTTGGSFACAGGETAVRFAAVTDGALHGDAAFNLILLRGAGVLVDPATGANGAEITVRSDHTGTVTGILRMAANQPTQLGVLRIQEATTGVYMDTVFVITGGSAGATLTALPDTFTFTGATSADCGTGSGTVQVFDGVPPYTATSSNTSFVTVNPSTSNKQPGAFTVTAGNPSICGDATVVITDSLGARTTVKVSTVAGSATPVLPIQVSPTSLTLGCGQTASVSAAGGTGTFSASSTDPNLTVGPVTGSTIPITRNAVGGATAGNVTSTVTVTDGASFATVSVTNPGTCP